MPDFIVPTIETDADTLALEAYSYLSQRIPGWVPAEGNLEALIIGAVSQISGELRDLSTDVPPAIFRYFGGQLLGLPANEATQATANTTWTVKDGNGYTIPDGTPVAIRDAAGQLQSFQTVGAVTILPGTSVTSAGAVAIQAIIPGKAASGLNNPPVVLATLDFVVSIALVSPTSGGVDAETDDHYLNRLTTQMFLFAPRPILPADFALFARTIVGVNRTLPIDGYDPSNATYNNPRMITLALMDELGAPVSSLVKAAVVALLQARREVNFIVNVIDPTTTGIDVTYALTTIPGQTASAVLASVNAALTSYLSPATWGPVDGDATGWAQVTTVRYLEISQVINQVFGVDFITTLTIRLAGGTMGTTNLTLPGVAPVPSAGALTGTVTVP